MKQFKYLGFNDMGKTITSTKEQCTIHNVVDSALWKDEKHSHFWVEDGELYESYNTIRGLRYRHRLSVNGVADCDNCPLDMLLYIVKEHIED